MIYYVTNTCTEDNNTKIISILIIKSLTYFFSVRSQSVASPEILPGLDLSAHFWKHPQVKEFELLPLPITKHLSSSLLLTVF